MKIAKVYNSNTSEVHKISIKEDLELKRDEQISQDYDISAYLSRVLKSHGRNEGSFSGWDSGTDIGWIHLEGKIKFFRQTPQLIEKFDLNLSEYDFRQGEQLTPMLFEHLGEVFALLVSHSEFLIAKLFERFSPVKMESIHLENEEFIQQISSPKRLEDRISFLILTTESRIIYCYLALPRDSDPQFHSEVKSIRNINSRRSRFSLTNISTEISSIFFNDRSKSQKIENDQTIKKCILVSSAKNQGDSWTAGFTYCWKNKLGYSRHHFEEIWKDEKLSRLSDEKVDSWDVNLVEILSGFEADLLNERLETQREIEDLQILDVLTYSIKKNFVQAIVLYQATTALKQRSGSKTSSQSSQSESRISVQIINFVNNKNSRDPVSIKLKLYFNLYDLPSDAYDVKAVIHDLKNQFIFNINCQSEFEALNPRSKTRRRRQNQNASGAKTGGKPNQSVLMASLGSLFSYRLFRLDSPIIGSGFSVNTFEQNSRTFRVLTPKGIYSLLLNEKAHISLDSILSPQSSKFSADSMREYIDVQPSRRGFTQTLTVMAQQNLIETKFKEYFRYPNDQEVIFSIRNQRANLSTEVVESKIKHMTYRIVESVNRNMVIATWQNTTTKPSFLQTKADREAEFRPNIEDMITIELRKKEKKLDSWIDFLLSTKLLDMISSSVRYCLLECKEILAAALQIRKLQRENILGGTEYHQTARKIYLEAFQLFLECQDRGGAAKNGGQVANSDVSGSAMNEEPHNAGQQIQEEGVTETSNSDKFFLYLRKNNYLISCLIRNFDRGGVDATEQEKRDCFQIIANLVTSILQRIQPERDVLRSKLNLRGGLPKSWWCHQDDFLYEEFGICRFVQVFLLNIGLWNGDEEGRVKAMGAIKNLVQYLLVEVNQAHNGLHSARGLAGGHQGVNYQAADQRYEEFVNLAMQFLMGSNMLDLALQLAERLKIYVYVCDLFIKKEHNFNIKKYFNIWGEDFLNFFIRYTCELMNSSDDDGAGSSNSRRLYLMNEMGEYSDQIRPYLKEHYPGLVWMFLIRQQGVEACLKDVRSITTGLDANGSEGLSMLNCIQSILETTTTRGM